jgi:hypothetical protein
MMNFEESIPPKSSLHKLFLGPKEHNNVSEDNMSFLS